VTSNQWILVIMCIPVFIGSNILLYQMNYSNTERETIYRSVLDIISH